MEIEEFLNDNNYRHVSDARKRLKEKLVEYKGGACEVCGYNKCITALEFHHVNPNEKEFGIGSMKVLSFEKCKKEVDKCMLVCANCHREIHHQQAIEKQQKEESINEGVKSKADIYRIHPRDLPVQWRRVPRLYRKQGPGRRHHRR